MSLCLVVNPDNSLSVSDILPCSGTVVVSDTDLSAFLNSVEPILDIDSVSSLFAAAVSLYALTFIIRIILRQMGFGS